MTDTSTDRRPVKMKCPDCDVIFVVGQYPISIENFTEAVKTPCPICSAGPDKLQITAEDAT